jgi:hypothetical protein
MVTINFNKLKIETNNEIIKINDQQLEKEIIWLKQKYDIVASLVEFARDQAFKPERRKVLNSSNI